jgi:hypothetical protein
VREYQGLYKLTLVLYCTGFARSRVSHVPSFDNLTRIGSSTMSSAQQSLGVKQDLRQGSPPSSEPNIQGKFQSLYH